MDWAYFKLTYMHKMITVDAGEGKYELIVLVSRYALCELETAPSTMTFARDSSSSRTRSILSQW